MTVSAGFVDMLKEQLVEFGSVSVRRMFGGAGVYNDGVMFGLIADDLERVPYVYVQRSR